MIEYLPIEAGDVVEFHDGERVTLPPQERDQWEVFHEGGNILLRIGHGCYDGDEIRAIHKPGTVGAMSHEERSRLWDKMEEYHIDVFSNLRGEHKWTAWASGEILADGNGQTRLEAVAKCVAAIEQQQKESTNG